MTIELTRGKSPYQYRISPVDAQTIFEFNNSALAPVRSAYSLLMGRVLALAGQASRSKAEILETGANHGSG